jgi:hypothetical protein
MPTETISFGPNQASGDQQIAGASPSAFNVLIDGVGAVRRRPGIVQWPDMVSGFGLTGPFANQPYAIPEVHGIASFEGAVHYITAPKPPVFTTISQHMAVDSAGVVTSVVSPAAFFGTERPTFALTQFRLWCSAGSTPNNLAGTAGLVSDPAVSRQIVALSSRLMSDDGASATTSGRIRFSGVGATGHLTFGALNFVTAEARPDGIKALRDNSNELYAFGDTTLQVFTPDPISVLTPGRAINRGCAAAHSVIRADESFAWLDDQKQFVMSDGRSMDVISDPIAETLDSISTVSDCWGFRYNEGQFDALVWVFPADGRTFAFQRGGGWAQWSGWTPNAGHGRFPGTAHYFFPEQSRHLVGLPMEGIGYLDLSASSDYVPTTTGSEQRLVKADVTTGFLNRGTDVTKTCKVLRLTVKPGATSSATTEPQLLVSWRDDPNESFGEPLRVGLGTVGASGMVKELRTLGPYRSRQWKVEFTDASDFVLARAEETYSLGAH